MSEEMDYKKYTEVLASFDTLAMAIFAYYAALIKEGFSDQNAIYLTAQWQNTMLQNATTKGEKS